MPEFKAKLFSIDLDKGRYSQELDQAIKTQMRQAGRAFVRIAAASIPVRTGFARGTLQNILDAAGQSPRGGTDAFGVGNFLNDLARIRNPKLVKQFPKLLSTTKGGLKAAGVNSINGRRFEFYTGGGGRILKTSGSGRQFATSPKDIFGSATAFGSIATTYTFKFKVDITYFNVNDFFNNRRTPSAPWRAFERGKAFFIEYMRSTGLKKLPSVGSFLTETEIKVTGTGISKKKLGVISRGGSTNG